ncbi:MAG: MarR family transcriptional regulator [Alkalispirochaeta sp.]
MTEEQESNDAELLGVEEQFCFAVYSTSHALNKMYKPMLDNLGLTYPQYLAMLVLWEHDGLRVGELGQRLYLESSTLTPLLKRLESRGLLERARSPGDERHVRVYLTENGNALRERAKSVAPAIINATGFDPATLDTLRRQLFQIRSNLLKASENRG